VILAPNLLELLREWWRVARKKGWMSLGQPWLFPSYRGKHTSARQLHRIVRLAAGRAGIAKRVGVHALRHSFATHLLEQETDIRIIQRCYGASDERTASSSLQYNRRGAPCHSQMT
jgi:integrase/recombinase XerD